MGILEKIIGGSAAQPVEAVGNVLDKLFTSDAERLDRKLLLERLRQQPQMAQVELNKIEASSRHAYTASWRPSIGYCCALGLLMVFFINPWIQWITGAPGPEMPLEAMQELVVAMLGLSALRSGEKVLGRAK